MKLKLYKTSFHLHSLPMAAPDREQLKIELQQVNQQITQQTQMHSMEVCIFSQVTARATEHRKRLGKVCISKSFKNSGEKKKTSHFMQLRCGCAFSSWQPCQNSTDNESIQRKKKKKDKQTCFLFSRCICLHLFYCQNFLKLQTHAPHFLFRYYRLPVTLYCCRGRPVQWQVSPCSPARARQRRQQQQPSSSNNRPSGQQGERALQLSPVNS